MHDGVGPRLPGHEEEGDHHVMEALVVVEPAVLCQQPQDHTCQLLLHLALLLLRIACRSNITVQPRGYILYTVSFPGSIL